MNIPLISTIELGLIYSLVSLGVYLTFRLINFPDLTVDGSFPLGAAVVATLLTLNVHPVIATIIATLAGFIAGSITGFLYIRLRIMGLLASILTMTALYSINMRIMGRPNVALLNIDTIFSGFRSELFVVSIIVTTIFLFMAYFLISRFGLALRATGINSKLSKSYGVFTESMILLTLVLSNSLVALSGALFAQIHGFADVSLGTGTIIVGLASVMIGEALLNSRKIYFQLLACLIGSLLYRFAIAIALNTQFFGLQASDLNLITTSMVVLALLIPRLKNFNSRSPS